MRAVVSPLLVIGLGFVLSLNLNAQISQPLSSLQLQDEPRPTQVPPFSTTTAPQCDSAGAVYFRYANLVDDSPVMVATIEPDGSMQAVSLAAAKDSEADNHVFLFSVGNDGSLHEILRTASPSDQSQAPPAIEYATFDSDGSLRSVSDFEKQFLPATLLPLPSGGFFASGVTLDSADDGVTESPLAGIFNSDATLIGGLQKDPPPAAKKTGKKPAVTDDSDTVFDGGIAKLGGDGNIYVLLPGDKARVEVMNQSGHISREMTLKEPFETDVAHDMWVSGNRLLVIYEGEADDPKDAYRYVLYDAQNGQVIRVYQPEFSGTVACFHDGQSLSVLLREPATGKITLGTADLR